MIKIIISVTKELGAPVLLDVTDEITIVFLLEPDDRAFLCINQRLHIDCVALEYLILYVIGFDQQSITHNIFIMDNKRQVEVQMTYRMSTCDILDPDCRLYRTMTMCYFFGKCNMGLWLMVYAGLVHVYVATCR